MAPGDQRGLGPAKPGHDDDYADEDHCRGRRPEGPQQERHGQGQCRGQDGDGIIHRDTRGRGVISFTSSRKRKLEATR